ncbi:hypothetical protein DU002_16835 [Corallincola holothuriorum]|uniref:Uncharacterized protein n=1 Tax=Corallincola holothuriorum TaxID=2282215 RepID=A0A368N6F4_9GAMM|nr:hypothetical protein [Corallincola holothuriorum]RCU45095.1 hypothetical protein DU002_16835 [Corallincola holothuriorum]
MYRSGKLQEVRSKNAPCVFDIPAMHGGRMPKALRGARCVQEVRSKNAPCVFDIPAIHGGRIPKALRGVSFVADTWNPIYFVGCANV